MKHLKTYEGLQKTERERRLQLKKIKLSNADSNPIPGMFVIFLTNHYDFRKNEKYDILFLGKIFNIDNVGEEDSDGDILSIQYVNIHCVDFEAELSHSLKKGKNTEFRLPLKNILFTSTSLKKSREEFNRLKETQPYCDWEMNREAKKYNM